MNNDITDFMLSEYASISKAHFETSNQLSLFFRYYLIIISAPVFVFLLLNKDLGALKDLFSESTSSFFWLKNIAAPIFIIVSIVGFLISIFITKIKFDNILYARTINGIRKYFETMDNDIAKYLVLPSDIKKPKYLNFSFFIIIFTIALLDSSYILLGLKIINFSYYFISSIIFFIIHILFYIFYCNIEEKIKWR